MSSIASIEDLESAVADFVLRNCTRTGLPTKLSRIACQFPRAWARLGIRTIELAERLHARGDFILFVPPSSATVVMTKFQSNLAIEVAVSESGLAASELIKRGDFEHVVALKYAELARRVGRPDVPKTIAQYMTESQGSLTPTDQGETDRGAELLKVLTE